MDHNTITELLVELVNVGGEVVMSHRGVPLDVHAKTSRADVVTKADLASEQAMLDTLSAARPSDGVISEERGYLAGDSAYTWVLDPLDGTANFARGSDNFGVIASLVHDDAPIAGAMLLPAIHLLYVAVKGQGATRNGLPVRARPERTLPHATIDHSLLHFADEQINVEQRRTLDAVLRSARGVRCDHSVRYLADTVDGTLDGFVYHSLGLWDIVGTSIILGEAGVIVTDPLGNELDFAPTRWESGRYYPTVGAAPALHGQLIEVLAS